jgi:hypothetical protein
LAPLGITMLLSIFVAAVVSAVTLSPDLIFFESIELVITARMAAPAGSEELAEDSVCVAGFTSLSDCAAAVPIQINPVKTKSADRTIK